MQQLLSTYPIPRDELAIVEIENRPDCDEIQNYMQSITGRRSVSDHCHNYIPSTKFN